MIIRVDKYQTFGITKRGSNAVQSQPKLFVNNEYIPPVPRDEDFEYFGRFFNYAMSNKSHKQILLDNTEEMMKTIDKLPLHPKYKILIYAKVGTINFERPVNYLCDAWHVFPPNYEAWTRFNN